MKTTVALEFEASELESFVVKILTKTLYRLLGSQDPGTQQPSPEPVS